jgi:hypothetical protein
MSIDSIAKRPECAAHRAIGATAKAENLKALAELVDFQPEVIHVAG